VLVVYLAGSALNISVIRNGIWPKESFSLQGQGVNIVEGVLFVLTGHFFVFAVRMSKLYIRRTT